MIYFKILLLVLLAAPVIAFAWFLFIQVQRYVNRSAKRDNRNKRDIGYTGNRYTHRSNERRPEL